MRARMSTKAPPATPSRLAASSLAARDAPLPVLINLARKIKAKSALLHRQRFVLTKSYVQLNKCYGKLDISEQKDVRFIAELALSTIIAARRKPSSRARETLRRIAIATIFTILKERSLLRKTCQADKIFRETWSKSWTEANCP